jgi:hypothetical protein
MSSKDKDEKKKKSKSSSIEKLKTRSSDKPDKKKSRDKKSTESDKKEKSSDKKNKDAPKKKRGRPFGALTKNRAGPDIEGYSALSKDMQVIVDMLEDKENDSAITLTQKAMLQTVIMMMPEAEKRFFANTSAHQAVYAFNALVTTARELIADVQAAEDKTKVIDRIIYDLLEPQILSLVNYLLESNFYLVKQLKPLVKEKHHKKLQDILNDATKSSGSYAKEMFATFKERLPAALE